MFNWQTQLKSDLSNKKIIYVTTSKEIKELRKRIGEEIALDTETYVEKKWKGEVEKALSPHTSRVSVISLSDRQGITAVIDCIELEDYKELKEMLLEKKRILAFNAKFDLNMLRKELNIVFRNFFCIRVLVKLVTNSLGSKFAKVCGGGLKDVIRDLLSTPGATINLEGKGKEQISDWYSRPDSIENIEIWQKKVEYAAMDVKYLFDIYDILTPVITNSLPRSKRHKGKKDLPDKEVGIQQLKQLELEQRTVVAIAEMEWNGIGFSDKTGKAFYEELTGGESLEGEFNRLGGEILLKLELKDELEVSHFLSYPIPKSHKKLRNPIELKKIIKERSGITGLDNVQTSTLNRLIDLFAEVKEVKEEESDKESVEWASEEEENVFGQIEQLCDSAITDSHELFNLIIRYKQVDKLIGMNLLKKVNLGTGRIHCSYDANGTSTGRLSSSNPNGQNISGRTTVLTPLGELDDISQPDDNLVDTHPYIQPFQEFYV